MHIQISTSRENFKECWRIRKLLSLGGLPCKKVKYYFPQLFAMNKMPKTETSSKTWNFLIRKLSLLNSMHYLQCSVTPCWESLT